MDWSWAGLAATFAPPPAVPQAFNNLTQDVVSDAYSYIPSPEQVANEKNANLQREFAQHGIRWRVEDAKAAGIHPLYALGASGASASPSFVAEGQDLSRAIHATRTGSERRFAELQLQRAQLENIMLGLQVHGLAQSQFGPSMPSADEDRQPNRSTILGTGGREAGSLNDYGYVKNDGKYYIVPSKEGKERTEDNMIQEGLWAFRNQLIPILPGSKDPVPPSDPVPPGYDWKWNGVYYEMVPVKKKSPPKKQSRWPKGSILRLFE